MTRQTASILLYAHAECDACPWRNTKANALGTAARHHDATGHPIRTTIARLVTFGDPHAQPTAQTTIDEHLAQGELAAIATDVELTQGPEVPEDGGPGWDA